MFHSLASFFGLWPHPQSLSKQQPEELFKVQTGLLPPFLKLFKGSQLHEEQNPRCPPWLTTGTGTFLHVPLAHPIPASPVPLLFLSHYKHAPPSGPLSPSEMILTLISASLLFLLIPGLRSCVMSSMRASLTTLPKFVIPSLRTQFVFFSY